MRLGRFAQTAALVAVITLTARIAGFGRWLVFSQTVADSCLGDVYNAANQLPNVLFEIVAGGVLAGVVIPVVARHAGAGRSEQAAATSSALLTWTLLVLTPAALAALLASRLYADAFTARTCPGGAEVGAALLVIFVPQIWLYGLAVVSAGILQAHSRFLAAALSPLLSSAVVIGAYLLFGALVGERARTDVAALDQTALAVLGWGTTAGVAALAATTLVGLARLGLRLRPRLRFADGDAAAISKIAGAGVAGLIVQQLTMLLITWTAKQTLDPGAITRTTWANAIYLLPFAVLVAPVLQMIFPRLSAAAEQGPAAVHQVLRTITPAVVLLTGLGAALLVATATPIARVFVSGPGSGRTDALALPIAAFAPAVIGFGLLGLASRVLLARHLARFAGITTVVAWVATGLAVLAVHAWVPPVWVVTGIGAAVSLGMGCGALTGWLLLGRQARTEQPEAATGSVGLIRTLLVVIPTALIAAVLPGLVARVLGQASVPVAILGGLAAAAACTILYVGGVFIWDRSLLRSVWTLRGNSARDDAAAASPDPTGAPG